MAYAPTLMSVSECFSPTIFATWLLKIASRREYFAN